MRIRAKPSIRSRPSFAETSQPISATKSGMVPAARADLRCWRKLHAERDDEEERGAGAEKAEAFQETQALSEKTDAPGEREEQERRHAEPQQADGGRRQIMRHRMAGRHGPDSPYRDRRERGEPANEGRAGRGLRWGKGEIGHGESPSMRLSISWRDMACPCEAVLDK